jgi:hypothetical protein
MVGGVQEKCFPRRGPHLTWRILRFLDPPPPLSNMLTSYPPVRILSDFISILLPSPPNTFPPFMHVTSRVYTTPLLSRHVYHTHTQPLHSLHTTYQPSTPDCRSCQTISTARVHFGATTSSIVKNS